MFRPKSLLAALGLSALAMNPAHADFDELSRFLAIIPPGQAQGGPVFLYLDPEGPLSAHLNDRTMVWPLDQAQLQGLANPGAATSKTGIDFTVLDSAFQTGMPPDMRTILAGPEGFWSEAPEVLEARGFTRLEGAAWPTFSVGEDFTQSIADRDVNDPFGSMMGRAQRLTLGEEFVLHATNTAASLQAQSALAGDGTCAHCEPWRGLLDAVRTSSGEGSRLEAANGWYATSFMGTDIAGALFKEDGTLRDPPEIAESLAATPEPGLPPFYGALFAATKAAEGSQAHLAILFPTLAAAQAAEPVLSERLAQQVSIRAPRETPLTGLSTSVEEAPLGATLVVTLSFPDREPGAAREEYGSWWRAILQRDFYPLSSG